MNKTTVITDDCSSSPALLPGDTPRTSTCSVVLALMQINRRATGMRQIGYIIYQVETDFAFFELHNVLYDFMLLITNRFFNQYYYCISGGSSG